MRVLQLSVKTRLAAQSKTAPVTAWAFATAIAPVPHRTHFSPMIWLHRMQNRVIRLRTALDELGVTLATVTHEFLLDIAIERLQAIVRMLADVSDVRYKAFTLLSERFSH
jgi:hypothetical protein